MNELYVLHGIVIDGSTGAGLDDCRVEARDASGFIEDMICYAVTDADGAFVMDIREEDRRAIFGDRAVSLSFTVLGGTTSTILYERGTERWPLEGSATELTLRISAGRMTGLASSVVQGTVSSTAGPLSEVYVQAYDENLGTLVELGDPQMTDERGRYRITYDPTDVPNGKQQPDLVVKAYSDEELTDLLAESERRCRAPAVSTPSG